MNAFGDNDDDLRLAFDHVMSGTTVKPFVADAIFPLWLAGHRRGEPKYERAAFYPLMEPEISFQWPWFDEWRGVFAKGDLPGRWLHMAERIKDRRLGLREDRVQLLSATLSMVVVNWRNAGNHAARPDGRGTLRVSAICPVSTRIATDRLSSVVAGDRRTYPPFFPGDDATVLRF